MFWSDWGYDAKIERAWMDGQHRQLVIGDKVIWPNGLTVDFVLDRLYWVDAKFDHIEVADFNGQHRRVVTSRGMQHPFSVTVFEDTLYVSEWTTGTVTVLNKFSGDNRTSLPELFHRPMGIQVYHPLRQPTVYNYCEPLQPKCSHLCLLKPGGASCACPRGYTLEAGHLCQITKTFTSGATPEISGISSVATTPVYLDRKNTISLSASTAKSFFGPSTKAVHESNLELLRPQEGVTEKQQTASTMTTENPAVPRGGSVAIDTDVTMTIPVSYKHPIATHKVTPPTVTARNQLDNVKGESGDDVTTVSSTTTRTLNEHKAQGAHTKSVSMVTVQVPSNGHPEREHVDNEGPSVNNDLPNKTKLCIATCLNGGNCEGGICVCWKGFTGPSCEVMISSNLTNEKPEGKEEAGDLSIVVIPVMSVLVVITVIIAAVSCYCKKQRMKSHLLLIKYSNRHNQVKQTDEEHLVEHAFHNPAFASEEDESDHQNASLHNSQCTIVTSSDSSDSAFTDEKSDEQNT
ncbi:uncharacterized protein LOC106154305 [Lingula anatina]|uniref:Uncharacterized protein LOC106154305 n=1 Tax=Lingula anatina TaxID=7574 RepID=A0A1S3HGC6_LINAN|nr:uncharacterized protein LOC106154305 [Lingula anatina]|eukprot:XP_013384074.1 uncharacterized protein LOC106154305 [Lingula anatina]